MPRPRSRHAPGPDDAHPHLSRGRGSALGNSNNNIPFSWTPCSYQQVHSLASFSSGTVLVVQRMSLRMAGGFLNSPGSTVDLEVFMAESPNDAASASGTFASNVVSGSEINVLPRQIISLPVLPTNDWRVTLPFDLTPVGAPGCSIYVNWLLVLSGVTNANSSGSVQINVPLPADPALSGATIMSQYLFADAGANALGLFSSNGNASSVGQTHNLARVYGLGGPGLLGGALERQYGMAIGFN